MAQQVDLLTTEATLEELYPLADGKKRVVRVNRDALNHLLIDYGVMLNALRGSATFKVVVPKPHRQRP